MAGSCPHPSPLPGGKGAGKRSLRAVGLLRLFRILKLARYSAAIQRFHRAFVIAREELILFGATAAILLYLAAVGLGGLTAGEGSAGVLSRKRDVGAGWDRETASVVWVAMNLSAWSGRDSELSVWV